MQFPRNQHEVPAVLKELRANLNHQRAVVKATEGLIKAVQAFCEHPKKTYRPDGYGGGGDTYCNTCGAVTY